MFTKNVIASAIGLLALSHSSAQAVEYSLSGLVEVAAVDVSGSGKSFADGGWGKFRFNNDNQASVVLNQLVLSNKITFTDTLSASVTLLGYQDDVNNEAGVSEAYIQYKGLPTTSGYRFSGRAGILYPHISMNNFLIGWNSPYTVSYSTINSWIAEELRHLGAEVSVERLGKFHQSDWDIKLTASLLTHNDPTGALLAWHGWNIHNRQSLWHEKLQLPPFPALQDGGALQTQAWATDPFKEIDDKVGYHIVTEWKSKKHRTQFNLGYYDNRADPFIEEQGQYAWHTKFVHGGLTYRVTREDTIIMQFMHGSTVMQNWWRKDIVNNQFSSATFMYSHSWGDTRLTGRAEVFNIEDNDLTPGDYNDESGSAFTLSLRYKFSKQWYAFVEGTLMDTKRFEREIRTGTEHQNERMLQLTARYYF